MLQCGTSRKYLQMSELWMSSGGTASLLHSHADENIHCVLAGRKDFILIHQKELDKPNLEVEEEVSLHNNSHQKKSSCVFTKCSSHLFTKKFLLHIYIMFITFIFKNIPHTYLQKRPSYLLTKSSSHLLIKKFLYTFTKYSYIYLQKSSSYLFTKGSSRATKKFRIPVYKMFSTLICKTCLIPIDKKFFTFICRKVPHTYLQNVLYICLQKSLSYLFTKCSSHLFTKKVPHI